MVANLRLKRFWAALIPGVCLLAALVWSLAFARGSSSDQVDRAVYRLDHVQAAEVQRALVDLLPQAEVRVDEAANRVIVRGDARAHQLAQNTIKSLDRPAAPPATPPATSTGSDAPVLKAYPCPAGDAARQAARLQSQLPAGSNVRISPDERSGQILVVAPPDVQSWVAQSLRAAAVEPPQAAAPAGPARPEAMESHTVQLQNRESRQVEAAMLQMLAGRLTPLPGGDGQQASYRLAVSEGSPVELLFERPTNRVTVRGVGRLMDSCIRLVRALDGAGQTGEAGMQLVSVKATPAAALDRTIAAVTADVPAAQPPAAQPPAAQPPAAPVAPPGPPTATQPQAAAPESNLVGPVRIEMLEGLDVMVIRGNKRDVDRVVEIINEIERLSAETEPAVEIHQLKHVDCTQLATLVTQLYSQVFSPRQGAVSITALVKPNALLLVGRPESVRTVVDLVARLDQPVAPETQFQVFQLRHASAQTAETQIEGFYEERGGLGAKVRVTADYRSNSLIVQAAPRDVAEVAELIGRIDTPTSAAINELRVFTLENSLAADLAPILHDAIAAQAPTGQRARPAGGAAAGGAGGAPGANQPSAAAGTEGAKSTMLRFLTVDQAGKRRLNSGILTDVRITADARANTLLVSAPADSMDLIEALIRQLDKLPLAEAQVKVFTIINGDASAMVDTLETLFGQQQQRGAEEPAVQTAAVEGESTLVPLRFAVDIRSNSIIATGSVGSLGVVEAILLRIDESEVRNRKSMVHRLKNSFASDVATAVNEFLRSERQVETQTQGLYSAFEQIEREVIVVAEPVSNSLIVSATPRFFDEIEKLIEKLDERPPMVMIQVLIAEVTLNNLDEFGIELGLQDSLLFDRSLLSNLNTTTKTTDQSTPSGIITVTEQVVQGADNTPGFNFNNQQLGNSGSDKSLASAGKVASQGLSSLGVGRVNSELGYGGLVLSAASESVSVLVRALQECGRLEVLSRPQVMTLDNQEAFIQVGQRVSLIRGTATNEAGQTNQVLPEDIGLILRVTPRISPDGLVVMHIMAEKSALGPESEGTPVSISATGAVIRQPPINTTTADTTVAALNSQTVILGGLITKTKQENHRSVPFLSSIPILGHLFRYDFDSQKRTELLIIMTPHIVKTEADADAVRQIEASRMHWCLADVIDITGDVDLRGRKDDWPDAETRVVYPDMKPDGEVIPAPQGRSAPLKPIPEANGSPFKQERAPGPPPSRTTPELVPGTPTPADPADARLRVPAADAAYRNQASPAGQRLPTVRDERVEPAAWHETSPGQAPPASPLSY
ncbi:MAG: hypothetical protein NTW96_14115 [Planctomycetia bacterium]|nr:hypothetical protein [Planctomycetia bacterium]